MEEDFEGLTMLTNYLEKEVGFTGMNRYKKQPDVSKTSIKEKESDDSDPTDINKKVKEQLDKREKPVVTTGAGKTGDAVKTKEKKTTSFADILSDADIAVTKMNEEGFRPWEVPEPKSGLEYIDEPMDWSPLLDITLKEKDEQGNDITLKTQ